MIFYPKTSSFTGKNQNRPKKRNKNPQKLFKNIPKSIKKIAKLFKPSPEGFYAIDKIIYINPQIPNT